VKSQKKGGKQEGQKGIYEGQKERKKTMQKHKYVNNFPGYETISSKIAKIILCNTGWESNC
jgi:hypothetical protein